MAAILGACNDNIDIPGNEAGGNTVITASIDDASHSSRTCVDLENQTDDFVGLLWTPGDRIGVYGENEGVNIPFTAAITGNAAKADFLGSMPMGIGPWRAYYPYDPANAGRDVHDLLGHLAAEQPFDMTTGQLTCDYKYGAPVAGSNTEFSFQHLFTLLEIDIDASSTDLEGEKLDYITLTVTGPDGSERPIAGNFHFSAVDGSWNNVTNPSSTIKMPWTDNPTLDKNKTYTGFITVMPVVKSGDRLEISVVTDNHKASFTASAKVTFRGGYIYCLPLSLGKIKADSKYGWEQKTLPAISNFKFEVAKNPGKLLDNETVWSNKAPSFKSGVKEQVATIANNEISLEIPYLYDRTLVPTFTVADGVKVMAGDTEVISGETEIDFVNVKQFIVTNGTDERHYKVNLSNTGLPVVVIKQSTSGDFSDEKVGGTNLFGTIIGGTVCNTFVDFKIRGKETDWVDDDEITVYNADGTIDMPMTTCGVRLRGNTSKAYPKKPLAIKLTTKQKVLGMSKHKRWVLLANWLDHSMMRNTVAFDIAHAIESAWQMNDIEPGIPWNVHGRNVELVINGHYVGNYYLCEQIKIDSKRLDIQDCYEDVLANPEVEATFENCGYLLELDNNYDEVTKFKTTKLAMPINVKDEAPVEIVNQVKAKIDKMEGYLVNGNYAEVSELLDYNSVIDQWIIWELTQNREYTEPRSVYYYMNGDDKLCAGPVWDFDRATFQNTTLAKNLGNTDRIKNYDAWVYQNNTAGIMSQWMQYLLKDPNFCKRVQERWEVMYPYLQAVEGQIYLHAMELKKSYGYDSAMWPTTKADIQAHKSGFSDWSGDETINDHDELVENFVTVYRARLEGMNTLITSGKFTK